MIDDHKLITYNNKIYIPPSSLRIRIISWYHHFLCHPGGDRLSNTIQQVCSWPGMVNQCRQVCKKCATCQKFKKRTRYYGKLPPKQVENLVPWDTVCVDLVGPYSIKATQLQQDNSTKEIDLKLIAMTFIDPATG